MPRTYAFDFVWHFWGFWLDDPIVCVCCSTFFRCMIYHMLIQLLSESKNRSLCLSKPSCDALGSVGQASRRVSKESNHGHEGWTRMGSLDHSGGTRRSAAHRFACMMCIYYSIYIYIYNYIVYIYIYTYVCANIVSECLWLDGLAIRRFCGFDPCRLIHSAVRRLLTLCPGGCGVELERQRRHKTRQSRNTTEVWEWCWCTCPFYVFIGAAKGEKQPF